MTRRDFLYNAAAAGGTFGALPLAGCFAPSLTPLRAVPTKEQLVWAEQELGMFFHFDIPVFKPGWKWRTFADFPEPSLYNPAQLDTDQWMEAAKAMGAKYVVLVAKHCSGFLQWQSDLYAYGVKQSSWRGGKGDLVADFVASARRAGLKPGLYASVSANGWLNVDNPGLVNRGKGGDDEAQKRYAKICEGMARELWTRYGDLFEIWFDGGALPPEEGGPDLMPILLKYQPQAILFLDGEQACPALKLKKYRHQKNGVRTVVVDGCPAGRHDLKIRPKAPWVWANLGIEEIAVSR